MSEHPTRICILGGGFGGLYTALRLSELPWMKPEKPDIVLIDRSDRFVFSPLLYELMTGELQTWEVAPLYQDLLANTDVQFYQTAVAGINIQDRRVHLQDGSDLPYDKLVLALGGETPLDRVPGAIDHAVPFRTIADAHRLAARLRSLETSERDRIRVAIVGGGYSGVELACKLADRLGERGRIRIIELADQMLRTSTDFNRQAADHALKQRDIWIDLETSVESLTADTVSLNYKGTVDTIPVDVVLWTVGTRMAEAIAALPLKKNQRGQITVHPTLQVIDYPDIWAIGDLADCKDASGQQVPMTAQVALQQADFTAWNIWASLTHRPLLPFRYQQLGEMLSLGIDNATLTAMGIKLEGLPAVLARRLTYLYRMPTLNHQIRVGLNWIMQPIAAVLSSLSSPNHD